MCRRLFAICIAVFVACSCGAQAEQPEKSQSAITAKAFLAEMDSRRRIYKTVDATVRQNTVIRPQQKLPPHISAKQAAASPLLRTAPDQVTWRLCIDGPKCRLESGDVHSKDIINDARVEVFDGKNAKTLYPAIGESGTDIYPYGFVFREPSRQSDSLFIARPLYWTFSGIGTGVLGFDKTKLLVQSQRGIFDESECVIIECPGDKGATHNFWIDPAKDYSTVRYSSVIAGQTTTQLDCHYQKDQTGLWLPHKWTAWWFDRTGQPSKSFEAEVIACVVNKNMSEEVFNLEFPPGTIVSDLPKDCQLAEQVLMTI